MGRKESNQTKQNKFSDGTYMTFEKILIEKLKYGTQINIFYQNLNTQLKFAISI